MNMKNTEKKILNLEDKKSFKRTQYFQKLFLKIIFKNKKQQDEGFPICTAYLKNNI